MASRSALFGVLLIVFFSFSIFTQESEAAIKQSKKNVNQLSVQEKPQSRSKKLASDFTFADDEDTLMQGDDSFASSGDGPDLESTAEPDPEPTPEPTSPHQEEHQTSETEASTDDSSYVWPEHGWNETSPEEVLPDGYYPIDTCQEKQYFCRYGYRGPCHRNEIFTTTSLVTNLALFHRQPTCSTGSRWDTCLSSLGQSNSVIDRPLGFCTVRYPSRPCFGYPSYYRYYKRTKRCYPCRTKVSSISSNYRGYNYRGPCTADQIYTAVDLQYGQCKCRRPNHVYCRKTHRCYAAYTRASCSQGYWLVPSNHGGICRPCPCPSMADGHHIYWSGTGRNYGRSGCYKSYTQGPCRPGMYFRVENFATGSWRCVRRQVDNRMGLYSLVKDWQLFSDMSLFGPVIDRGLMDDIFTEPWF